MKVHARNGCLVDLGFKHSTTHRSFIYRVKCMVSKRLFACNFLREREQLESNLSCFLLSKYFFLLNHKFAEKTLGKLHINSKISYSMTHRNNTLVYSLSIHHHSASIK